jgi:hypothetical protein
VIGVKIVAPMPEHVELCAAPTKGTALSTTQVNTAGCGMTPAKYLAALARSSWFSRPPDHLPPDEACECGLYAFALSETSRIVLQSLLPYAISFAFDKAFPYGDYVIPFRASPAHAAMQDWRRDVRAGKTHALALVEGFGKVIVHELGFRAEKMRFLAMIEADWPSCGLPVVLLEDLSSVLGDQS